MEKDVTRGIEEQLSAFLDGELPDEEVALLIRRLDREESYRDTLASFAAVGSVLRGEPSQLASLSLHEAVHARISADGADAVELDADLASSAADEAPRRRSVLPFAAAAGLAVAALAALLVSVGDPGAPGAAPELAAVETQALAPAANALAINVAAAAPQLAVVRVAGGAAVQQATVPAAEAVRIAAAERRVRLNRERMMSYLISHGEQTRSFPGSFSDSRMYVQQASFAE